MLNRTDAGLSRRGYRWAIYTILFLVMGAGITLSHVMSNAASAIHRAAQPSVSDALSESRPHDLPALLERHELIGHYVDRIAKLVYWFDLLALGTAVILLYHVWVRFRVEDRLAHQASHEPLTGLGHRRAFEQRLANLHGAPHSLLLASIERFDRISSAYGHEFADHLTIGISARLSKVARQFEADVFRLDGGGFLLLYRHELGSPRFNDAVAALREQMTVPFVHRAHEVFPLLSLGAAEYPRHGSTPAQLLRNVVAASQSARRLGNGLLVTYSEELNAQAERRLDLEAQIVRAVERNELLLHFQPQQRLSDGSLSGFEALLRWRRNGLLVSPMEFIPAAEESGQVVAIGDWVLEEACRQIRRLQENNTPTSVAVNISPRQFLHPSFAAKIEDLLSKTGIDASLLELEITEGAVMEQTESAIGLLKHLRGLGLKLAIDDFGTGYSSLGYLKRFPIDKLKIDQSFIRQLGHTTQDAAIVRAVIDLGCNLEMCVTAEGVETLAQREWLQRAGCDQIQGYLYGKPMPATEALAFARARWVAGCGEPA
ncbi:putative bifunctional diguanylate cyclase/phosphodiesterase [Herbaspirillum chlorophenolicum]|uniref:putative bifunctional diguanylate cyclase/phosphodiesterase n=2 Tax=Herbaspirillum chlorophenolicum TaxID=211589 RepID=UPI000773F5DF|nr:GGDEF domain-containing phosphodiesterase [Herbaspirillum chlorophenolicum]